MQRHLPYTDQQWEADHKADQPGHPLSCPDCNSDVWCHATDRIVKGALFRYRMCKRCGFWQAADGRSAPVRCWKSEHLCTRPNVEASYVCGHCLTMLTPREPGRHGHAQVRVVPGPRRGALLLHDVRSLLWAGVTSAVAQPMGRVRHGPSTDARRLLRVVARGRAPALLRAGGAGPGMAERPDARVQTAPSTCRLGPAASRAGISGSSATSGSAGCGLPRGRLGRVACVATCSGSRLGSLRACDLRSGALGAHQDPARRVGRAGAPVPGRGRVGEESCRAADESGRDRRDGEPVAVRG